MNPNNVKLITENLSANSFLQALFLGESRRGLVEVGSLSLPDEAVGAAELSLLQHPGRPMALVLNARRKTPEGIAKKRRALGRILARITRKNWHVALANPNVLSWVLADPEVDAEYQAAPDKDDFCLTLPSRIVSIAEQRELDRRKIGETHPEFLELVEFIQRHAPVPTSPV